MDMKIQNLEQFQQQLCPMKTGNSPFFGGTLIEHDNAPIMKLAAANYDKRCFTLTYDKKSKELVVKSGLNFSGWGYFITEKPATEQVTFML